MASMIKHYKKTDTRTYCGRQPSGNVWTTPALERVTCTRCSISANRAAKANAERQARMFANND